MDSYIDNSTNRPAGNPGAETNLKNSLKDEARSSKEQLAQSARTAGERVKQEADKNLGGAVKSAAGTMDDLSHAAESAARTLHEEHHESLSHYVADIAHYVSNVASSLRSKNTDELIHDAKRMARENPALFIAGSVAIGLGIARLAKSGSQSGRQYETRNEYGRGISASGSYGDGRTAYGREYDETLTGQSAVASSSTGKSQPGKSPYESGQPDLDGPSKSYTTSESINDRY